MFCRSVPCQILAPEHVFVARRVAPKVTDIDRLHEFVGEYFSEELEMTYELYLAGGELFNRIPLNDMTPWYISAPTTRCPLGGSKRPWSETSKERSSVSAFRLVG